MANLRNTDLSRRIIYLGDFYSPWSASMCIEQIRTILEYHGVDLITPFTDSNVHDIPHLQEMWQELFERKLLHIYKDGFVQFFQTSPLTYPTDSGTIFKGRNRNVNNGLRTPPSESPPPKPPQPQIKAGTNKFSILADDDEDEDSDTPPPPKKTTSHPRGRRRGGSQRVSQPYHVDKSVDYNQSLGSTNKPTDPIFIFGNKEVAFVRQLLQPIKIVVGEDNRVIVTYHSFRKYDKGAIRVNTYTAAELNVMYTVLNHCRHYYTDNGICYVHCYRNARYLDSIPFNKIVCGHNKAFGMFKDDEIRGKFIFMLDYTIVDDENLLPSQVYFDVNKTRVIMNDDRFFPPAMIDNCRMISVSDNMVTTQMGDWIDPANDVEVHHAKNVFGDINSVPIVNRLTHLNKYTQRHDCYSDTELVDDDTPDHITHREA